MVEIRPYRPDDFDAVARFIAGIQEHERSLVPGLVPGDAIAEPYAEHILACVAARDGLILIAEAEGRPVGFVSGWLAIDDDMLLADEARAHALVSDIFVLPDWRRRGVARRLLAAMEDGVCRRGCRRLRICGKAANLAALGTYGRAGYRPYEVILQKELE